MPNFSYHAANRTTPASLQGSSTGMCGQLPFLAGEGLGWRRKPGSYKMELWLQSWYMFRARIIDNGCKPDIPKRRFAATIVGLEKHSTSSDASHETNGRVAVVKTLSVTFVEFSYNMNPKPTTDWLCGGRSKSVGARNARTI